MKFKRGKYEVNYANWNGNKYDGSVNIMAKHNRIEHNNDK